MALPGMTDEQAAAAKVEADRVSALRRDIPALFAEFGPRCMPAQAAQIKTRLQNTPISHRLGYLTAMRGRSKAAGIRAFCLECMGDDRVAVAGCSDLSCALYPYRPGGAQ